MVSQKKKDNYGSRGMPANLVCKYVMGSGSYSFEVLKRNVTT